MDNNPKNAPLHPDRPLECSECKNPISVNYTEIIKNDCTITGMCDSCPQLEKRLKGSSTIENISLSMADSGLACGECGTTLANIKVGHTVGCSSCYEVFGDFLVTKMMDSNKIFPGIVKNSKSIPLHVGRAAGETQEISPSLKLIALNDALEETLKMENYEQAALIRDKIQKITEDTEDKDDQKK